MSTSEAGTKPALISARPTTAESKWAGKECPHCKKGIEAGEAAVLCPKCYTPHHRDCWTSHGNVCAVDQTPANILERAARGAAPPAAAPAPEPAPVAATSAAPAPARAAPAPAVKAPVAVAAKPAAPAAAPAGGGASSARAMRSAARRAQAQLTTWPHLLMPEFFSAVLLVMGLVVMAWFVNAPLEEVANPNHTPNPSKAPWYFLNLQELLLHMHPSLAGVIIPTVVIVLLMAIPYLDIATEDTGIWFSGAQGKKVFWISLVYTTFWAITLILADKFIGIRAVIENAIPILKISWLSEIVTQTMVPTAIMWAVAVGLYVAIAHLRPTMRDVVIAYFTAFAVAWILLAIVGSAFRGPAMELYWPWNMPARVA
ncbi:MAG: hypothetical protein KGS10_01015 [Chloroflexi bacterium]|jgi:hypothetical protein|nr:hypothetical protein [Chloroflexota bacterium]